MPGRRLNFGPFQLDQGTQLVLRDGEPLPVGQRGVRLFEALIARPGEVVTKSELLDAVWGDTAVEESNLSVQVAALRKALGPSPSGDWIVTIPRVGYRLISMPTLALPVRDEQTSIAVLPFVNLSSDPEQAFFADGLAEEIITALGKLPGLVVIARNSSFAYRGSDVDVRKIGSDLDVRFVLSGSVRRGGVRLRMNAQLADASNGTSIWAESFDREVADVFSLQDEMTRRIVEALTLKLTPAEAANATGSGTSDVEALDLVMRGRALLQGSTQNIEVFKRATVLFQRAIERDPTYIQAYEQLALAHVFDYANRWTSDPDLSLNEAKRLVDRAIEIAPNDASAHSAAALVASFSRDFERSCREIEATVALNPNLEGADHLRGNLCIIKDEPLDAVPHYERAMRRDPSLSSTILFLQKLAMAYFFGGRYETAVALLRERIVLMPDTDWSRAYLASALGHLGVAQEARLVWDELMTLNPNYALAERLYRAATQPRHIEMVLDGARKAGLPV